MSVLLLTQILLTERFAKICQVILLYKTCISENLCYTNKVRFCTLQEQDKILRRKKTMAVPARHTSSAKKNRRRTHYKLTAPTVTFDETTGDYRHSHRVSLKGYYKGRQVKDAK